MKKYRVLIIHDIHVDTPNGRLVWAYARRSAAIQKYAPPDFDVATCQSSEIPWDTLDRFNLIFSLEYHGIPHKKFRKYAPNVPVVVSFNSDFNRRREFWPHVSKVADFIIFNNMHAFDGYGRPKRSCCISNGVDTKIFRITKPIEEREHRVFWRGSTGVRKAKGWAEVLEPAMPRLRELGFIPDFKPVNDINPNEVLPTTELVAKYNECSYVVCAALSEGTPNVSVEGMACGAVLVSTGVGNVLEFGRDGENCVIVERSIDAMIDGLCYAREHRERLSVAGHETMQGWAYGAPGNRADCFFTLFRRILSEGVGAIKPFSYQEMP